MGYLYKKFRNKVVTEIRKSKNDYYADYFTNMKMFWSGIRSIVNSKTNVGSSISSVTHNGTKIVPKKANIFNNVFVNTAHKVNERSNELENHSQTTSHLLILIRFFIAAVTPEEIKIIINSMKNGKAVGPCSIPVYLLKILSEHIAVPLCDIMNDSFSSGVFPDLMKLAKVIPFYKKSSPENQTTTDQYHCYLFFGKIIAKLMHTSCTLDFIL